MAMSKMMKTAIPDMDYRLTEIFAVKDRVVVRFVVQGTHKAELEGIPATGKHADASATICIFRLKDGLVVEEVEEANMLGLYQQTRDGTEAEGHQRSRPKNRHSGRVMQRGREHVMKRSSSHRPLVDAGRPVPRLRAGDAALRDYTNQRPAGADG